MGVEVPPTGPDVRLAQAIAEATQPLPEAVARILTWGADEHVLCALALGWWAYSHLARSPRRKKSDHIALVTLLVTAAPHLLKSFFDQKRPDRLTIMGHLHGVLTSGNRSDAFPSGHAVHVGAMMSAASVLPRNKRLLAWTAGLGLVSTRVVLLAHWLSDVVAGLAIGIAIERATRLFTGYPRQRSSGQN